MTDTFLLQQRLDSNWARLTEVMADQVIQSFNDRDLYCKYMLLLNEIRQDRQTIVPGGAVEYQLGLYRAPASKDYHHRHEGGLVDHIIEMWQLWLSLRDTIRIFTGGVTSGGHPLLNDRLVWLAIFHHDLNKVWRYKLPAEKTEPFSVDYSTDEMHDLLGATSKIAFMLQKHGIQVPMILMNALLASEGGYNQSRPRSETVLAKTVYLLDELSANVVNRINERRFWHAKMEDV